MNSSKILKDYKEKFNYKILVLTLVAVIVILIIIFSLYNPWEKQDSLRIIILSFLATFESMLLAYGIWEVVAKRSFAKDLVELVQISENLLDSGIISIHSNFLNTDFHSLISSCNSKIIIAFTYGRTWRETNRNVLQSFVRRGGELEVFLPDHQNDELMHVLDIRFKYDSGKTRALIEESEKEFEKIGAKVYLFDGLFQTSYYILDNNTLLSIYNHTKTKGYVPAFYIGPTGSLHDFVVSEIDEIRANSIMHVPKE